MRRYRRNWLKNERGVVLVMALVLMGLLGALAAAYAMLVRADTVLSGGTSRMRNGFYAAEAGLNIGMAEFGEKFKHLGVPSGADFEEKTAEVGTRTVRYQLAPVAGYDPCTDSTEDDCYSTIPAGQKFAGLKSIPYRYTVESTALNNEGDEEANLGAEFDVHNIPIFQFLAFYANDLYIMPLTNMPLHGRVHTNGDLRLNADALLSIGDLPPSMSFVQVSAAAKIYRGAIKYGAAKCDANSVQIDKLQDTVAPLGDYDPQKLEPCNLTVPVSKTTLNTFKGSILDGVDTIDLPPVDLTDRGGSGKFWQQADLRIVLRLDPSSRAQINFGAADLCQGGPGTLTSPKLYPIEVQEADGSPNATKTRSLLKFMCQQRGAIFYTDVPKSPATVDTTFSAQATNYIPQFGDTNGDDLTDINTNAPTNRNYQVYRRAGVDTGGDGIIDTNGNATISNSDRNDNICPFGAGARPSWRPDYCNLTFGAWPNAAPPSNANGYASWFYNMDYRRGGFYNRREGKWMYLLNVNMRALIDWNDSNGAPLFSPSDRSDWGLVIFLSVQGPDSTKSVNNYGVRIFDSADLNTTNGTFPWPAPTDPTGLTVVSDQAMYIEGNYNSTNKYPAAVIGDALNVLSQGWEVPSAGGLRNDQKSTANLSSGDRDVPSQDGWTGSGANCGAAPCASFSSTNVNSPNLVINAAFLAGVGPSPAGEGNYDGGLENYPRFHESWDGRMLKIMGAFVSLGKSKHAVNNWACGSGTSCNIYDPPDRPWDYDTDFNDVAKLPPLTPMITYVQQLLYTRFYR